MQDLIRYRIETAKPKPTRPHQAKRQPQHTIGEHSGCIAELARVAGITKQAMRKRMKRWPPEKLLEAKVSLGESIRRAARAKKTKAQATAQSHKESRAA